MKIIRRNQAKHVDKPSGIKIDYFLFPEYEVHYSQQPAGSESDRHHHEKINETIIIINGELIISWEKDGEKRSEKIREGDLIDMGKTSHSLRNESGRVAKFVVIKQVLNENDNRRLFKNDKVTDSPWVTK